MKARITRRSCKNLVLEEEIHDANVSGAKIEYPFRENKLSQGLMATGAWRKGRGNQLSQGAHGHGVRREKCRGNQLRQLSRRDPQRFSNWYRKKEGTKAWPRSAPKKATPPPRPSQKGRNRGNLLHPLKKKNEQNKKYALCKGSEMKPVKHWYTGERLEYKVELIGTTYKFQAPHSSRRRRLLQYNGGRC